MTRKQRLAQIKNELNQRPCICRFCGTVYQAEGGNLCAADACRTKAGLPTMAELAASAAITAERERQARAERKARGRTEWREAVA